jgi:hypothetical protein
LAAVNKVTGFISGKISWAKVLGDPVINYNKDGREWTFEVEPDEAGIQFILKQGLADRIKGKGYNIGTKGQHAERAPFLQFKKPELNRDGEKNHPLRIYDENDVAWDPVLNDDGKPTNLIGNESGVDVKLDIRDYGVGKKKGVYPVAIRVTDHVPYESVSEFGGMEREAPAPKAKKAKKDTFKEDFGIEPDFDDVPFD